MFQSKFHAACFLLAAVLASGCANSTRVVSSSGGPGISQVQSPNYDGPRHRLAVIDFNVRSGESPRSLGSGMADMLIDSLVNTNRFVVLERERLEDIYAEQDRGESGRFRQDTLPQRGQLEGAELLVKGSIIAFEPHCRGGSAILVSAKQACLAINIRIIDAASGRIVNATTVEGTSSNNGVGLIYTRSSLPIGLGAWSNTPMELAMRNAIETAVQHIATTKF